MKSITYFQLGIKGAISMTSLAFMLPVVAIENPVAEEFPNQHIPQRDKEGQKKEIKGKKVAVLGVGGSPVSPTLAKHLGLEQGCGLTLFHVVPNSAAEKIGLKIHDVITELDGRRIGCQISLKKAVSQFSPGDKVRVKYIQEAKEKEGQAELGGRVMIFNNEENPHAIPPPFQGGLGHFPKSDRSRIQQKMQKHMEDMKQRLESQAGMELDLHGLFNDRDVLGGSDRRGIHDLMDRMNSMQGIDIPHGSNMSFSSTSSVTRRDEQGSITLKTMNDLKEVIVKDHRGNLIFEGAYNTAEDKLAVPKEIRHRLKRLNLDKGGDSSFRLHIPGGKVKLPSGQASGDIE